ncbi:MAG: hypothetical protein LV473_22325 [Nitrospira sp.]|nr:hypothetical protein [Nitrospira sp.]
MKRKGGSLIGIRLTPGQVRVLEGLDKGRRQAIEAEKRAAAINAALVMEAALTDLSAGGAKRGRAKRIALSLGPYDREGRRLTERSVLRILDKLSVCPIALGQNGQKKEGVYVR